MAKETNRARGWIAGQPVRFVQGHSRRRPLADRFWEKVQKAHPGECWPWLGGTNPAGYGLISINLKSRLASRVSWELHYSPIPNGLCALHNCDNPPYVNPEHLYLGTRKDNSGDCWARGRGRLPDNYGDRNPMRLHPELVKRGNGHPQAKLTEKQVVEIRELARTVSHRQLGFQFGVSSVNIDRIVSGKIWKHLQLDLS